MASRRVAAVAAFVLVAVLVAGCGGSLSANDDAHASQARHAALDKLRKRPSLEDTEQHMRNTVQRMMDALNGIAPGLRWKPDGDRDEGPCGGEYSNTGGRDVYLPSMVSDVPIPAAKWPRVLQASRQIAGQMGLAHIQVLRDLPDNRYVRLYGDDGNAVDLGTWETALVQGMIGCRLPANAKTR